MVMNESHHQQAGENDERIVRQGAVAIIAVILKNRLFVVSLGDCAAILCK